jgi:hypothetical protein
MTTESNHRPESFEVQQFNPAKIVVEPDRLRELDEKTVSDLVQSAKETGGIHTPIVVWRDNFKSEPVLVAGLHRLEACKRLGVSVPAKIVFFIGRSEKERKTMRKLVELDENLKRRDLTRDERDKLAALRGKLLAAEPPKPKPANPKGGKPASWFKGWYDAAGLSKRVAEEKWNQYKKETGETRTPAKAEDAKMQFFDWLETRSEASKEAGREKAAESQEKARVAALNKIYDFISAYTDRFALAKGDADALIKFINESVG